MTKLAANMPSFLDELENIELEKTAFTIPTSAQVGNYLRSVPGRAVNYARGTPARVAEGVRRTGQAVGNFAEPIKNTRAGWHATWSPEKLPAGHPAAGAPVHPAFKAMMAYGLYSDAKNTIAKDDPTGQGRSKLHRGLAAAGSQLGGLIAAPVGGFAGPIAGSMIGGKIGDLAGKGIDRLRGYKTPPTLPPPPVGQQG